VIFGAPILFADTGPASLAAATWLRTLLPLTEAALIWNLAWFCATLEVTLRLGWKLEAAFV